MRLLGRMMGLFACVALAASIVVLVGCKAPGTSDDGSSDKDGSLSTLPIENVGEDGEEETKWVCSSCGATNTSPYCGNCGNPSPKVDAGGDDDGGEFVPRVVSQRSESGTYDTHAGDVFSYSYDIPDLVADTDGADSINASIYKSFGAQVDVELQAMDLDEWPEYNVIGYRDYRSGDIISIVMFETRWMDNYSTYGVYNYDCVEGTYLTPIEVLARKGIDNEGDFYEAVYTAILSDYEESNASLSEAQRQGFGYYDALEDVRQYSYEASEVYLDNEGDLWVIAKVPSLAGPSYFERELRLSPVNG